MANATIVKNLENYRTQARKIFDDKQRATAAINSRRSPEALQAIQLRQDLLDRRTIRENRIKALNQQYTDAANGVLDEQTLKFLQQQSDIGVPTLTSIFTGFELARSSASKERQAQLDRQVAAEERGFKNDVEQNRIDLELNKLDAANASALKKQELADINAQAAFESGLAKTTLTESNRGASTSRSRNNSLAAIIAAAGGSGQPQTSSTGPVASQNTNEVIAAVVVPESNVALFKGIGVPDDKHQLAQYAYDQAAASPLATQYPEYPAAFVAKIQAESAFDENAVSSAGAEGVAQIIPSTQVTLGVTDPFDPIQSISASIAHDTDVRNTLTNSGVIPTLRNVFAGYNTNVQNIINANGVPNIPETTAYVERIFDNFLPKLEGAIVSDETVVATTDGQVDQEQSFGVLAADANEAVPTTVSPATTINPATTEPTTTVDPAIAIEAARVAALTDEEALAEQQNNEAQAAELTVLNEISADNIQAAADDQAADALAQQGAAFRERFGLEDELATVPELDETTALELNTILANAEITENVTSPDDITLDPITLEYVNGLNSLESVDITPVGVQTFLESLDVDPSTVGPDLLKKLIEERRS